MNGHVAFENRPANLDAIDPDAISEVPAMPEVPRETLLVGNTLGYTLRVKPDRRHRTQPIVGCDRRRSC